VLTAERRREFDETGITRLPGAIAPAELAAMRAALWADLTRRYGIREGEPSSWRELRPGGFQGLARRGAFAAMASPVVMSALDALFGEGSWDEPARWGQPLVCFPEAPPWELPRTGWHLDLAGSPAQPLVAVRLFALLARLGRCGGATLAVAGSHRLVQRLAERAGGALRSADARSQLAAQHPWLAALAGDASGDRVQRFMQEEAVVGDVRLRVVELLGEAGDVVVMRTDTLHAISKNVRETPRLVVAQFVTRAGALADRGSA
jgi:hypothetical protein